MNSCSSSKAGKMFVSFRADGTKVSLMHAGVAGSLVPPIDSVQKVVECSTERYPKRILEGIGTRDAGDNYPRASKVRIFLGSTVDLDVVEGAKEVEKVILGEWQGGAPCQWTVSTEGTVY